MNKSVFICCDDQYVSKSVIALEQFVSHNANYDKAIIGTSFSDDSKELCKKYNVNLHEIDLYDDFIKLNDRPYGLQYPIECFYHFHAYKIMPDYEYLVLIEPDILTNKELDVCFESVHYMGGSYREGRKISSFPAIQRDYNLIQSEFGEGEFDNLRILGGLKVYNVKNLHTINFYETIVDYYKRSWDINCPRCGDDSLMVLYQIYNNKYITLFTPETHKFSNSVNISDFNKHTLDAISTIHLLGNSKWWKIKDVTTINPVIRYCYETMIEFIYNNFPLEFIKKYIPEIYHDLSNVTIPFYYWGGSPNFGDLITPYFLNRFCDEKEFTIDPTGKNTNIISCGSIMRLCKPTSLVYGSGIRDIDQNINKGEIISVRGPLTRQRLLDIGCYCPPVYGDPGLLLPEYYRPIITKKYTLGIIPHVIHYDVIKQMYENEDRFGHILIINLNTTDVESVINDIVSCEKIVSSSLHGLIVSDAYNIPNQWVKFNDEINGDDTKFYDYFQSVERKDNQFIDCCEYKELPSNILELIPQNDCNYNIKQLKEKMFFDESGIKNYTKYRYITMMNKESETEAETEAETENKLDIDEYIAYNKSWSKNEIIMISLEETYLKKSTIHSKHTDQTQLIKVLPGEQMKYIRFFDKNYSVVSYIT